jgi:hypothetical protein
MLRQRRDVSLGQPCRAYIPVSLPDHTANPGRVLQEQHESTVSSSRHKGGARIRRIHAKLTAFDAVLDAHPRKLTTLMTADRNPPSSLTRAQLFLRLITGSARRGDIEAAPGCSRRLIIRTLIVTLLCGAGVIGTNAALINDTVAPHGVVSLQFAHTVSEARAILETWGGGAMASDDSPPRLMDTAYRVLWLDFPFMAAYTVLFALLCGRLAAAERHRSVWRSAAHWGVAAAWVAGLADLSENIAHLKLLDQLAAPAADMLVRWAWLSASLKWTLIALIASLLAAGALRMRVRRASVR